MTTVEQTQRTAVQVRPVAGYIGADIGGIDISLPLNSQDVAEIRDALLRYKVIFFRGQELTHAAQVAFGSNFGELTYAHPHDEAPPENQPEIFTVDPRRYEERYGKEFRKELRRRDYGYFTGWHTDVTAAVNPPAASILRAETVPVVQPGQRTPHPTTPPHQFVLVATTMTTGARGRRGGRDRRVAATGR